MAEFPSFLWLNNIPWYTYATLRLSIGHQWMLGLFQVFATVSNTQRAGGTEVVSG